MKKLFFYSVCSLLIVACNNKPKTDDAASKKSDDMKALYQKNLADLQAGFAAFEKGDLDAWSATVADSAIWNSAAYGDTVHSKAHWKESLKYYVDNWTNIKLNNPVFLPGLDSLTHEMDGSVRYYGTWDAVHKSGVKTSLNAYGTYEFNKDNKVVNGSDYFDVGGLMNAVTPKSK